MRRSRIGSYILTYEYGEDGKEDVHEIYAYSFEQAKEYALMYCSDNCCRLLSLVKGVNYASAL